MTARGSIVVGVDGGSSARRALDWAIATAARRGVAVLAVHAWTVGPAVDFAARPKRALRRESVGLLKAAIRDAVREGPDVELRWSSVEGDAAAVLLAAARGAEMLVLAAHRGTAPAHRPLGSVTARCLLEATVPVVVLPEPLLGLEAGTTPSNDLADYAPAFSG